MKDKLFWNPIKLIKKQEGTTLIELIVAIAILSIVVTSFLIFFVQSSQTTQSSENITDATYLAQEEMEYLYHLSDSKTLDESIQALTEHASSVNGSGLDKTFTIQSEGVTFKLEMKESTVKTTNNSTLLNFILKGQKKNKQLIQLESKIPFKKEVQND
ncbi:prepilin-type N-terminal cleavage/methylation domain-containing protein [Marinilactibacillus psychrotolerans]|uniref:type IV pilus modification PilV family protein n=1 Tax=Marinilactibacillus psychrotolerans TaxID=191770 RepID=UPI00388463C7